MNARDDNGLTPEERALAQRLAKVGPQGEPSPSLDARILAMAHAAASEVSADAATARATPIRRRKPQTWVTTLGFAASLAIACGIAWNLREMPDTPAPAPVVQAPADEAVEYRPPPPPSMSARVVPRRPLNVPAPPPEESVATQPQSASRAPARAKVEPKPQAFAYKPAIVLDEAVHPAPAAPAPRQVTTVDSTTVMSAEQLARQSEVRGNAAPAAAAAAPAPVAAQREAADVAAKAARAEEPVFDESDDADVPPATANDPAVRDAWLLRIRELVHAGQLDQARESLQAFRARYPGQPLPEDLRALGQ